jgi:hypothetical protein
MPKSLTILPALPFVIMLASDRAKQHYLVDTALMHGSPCIHHILGLVLQRLSKYPYDWKARIEEPEGMDGYC